MLCNTHTKSKYKEVIKKLQCEAVVELTVGELYLPLTLSVCVIVKSICPLWGCGTSVWMHGQQILWLTSLLSSALPVTSLLSSAMPVKIDLTTANNVPAKGWSFVASLQIVCRICILLGFLPFNCLYAWGSLGRKGWVGARDHAARYESMSYGFGSFVRQRLCSSSSVLFLATPEVLIPSHGPFLMRQITAGHEIESEVGCCIGVGSFLMT